MEERERTSEPREKNQHSLWPTWLGSVGIRNWRKGREVPGLGRFRVGGGVRHVERCQDANSMDSVTERP